VFARACVLCASAHASVCAAYMHVRASPVLCVYV
jgi:hypothetical protein